MRTHYIDRSTNPVLAGAMLGFVQGNALTAPPLMIVCAFLGVYLMIPLLFIAGVAAWIVWWRDYRFALRIRIKRERQIQFRIIADTTKFQAQMERISQAARDLGERQRGSR